MEELIEKFEKETGLEFYTISIDNGEDLYSYDFVNWLIKQLPIHDVVGRSEQLVAFCRWYNQAIPSYETTEEEIVENYLRESN